MVMAVFIAAPLILYCSPEERRTKAMNKTLLPIRIVFILLCTAAGWLVCYTSANGTPTG
jgi:hypothetical protein